MSNRQFSPLENRIHTDINLRGIRERYGIFKGMQVEFRELFPHSAPQMMKHQIKQLKALRDGSK